MLWRRQWETSAEWPLGAGNLSWRTARQQGTKTCLYFSLSKNLLHQSLKKKNKQKPQINPTKWKNTDSRIYSVYDFVNTVFLEKTKLKKQKIDEWFPGPGIKKKELARRHRSFSTWWKCSILCHCDTYISYVHVKIQRDCTTKKLNHTPVNLNKFYL